LPKRLRYNQKNSPASATPSPAAAADWHATVRDFASQHFKHPAWGYSRVAPLKAEQEKFLSDLKRETENIRTL
jgi:hypothetical protein